MVGPTIAGVNARLPEEPYVLIPVVTDFSTGISGTVTVLGFLPFKLNGITGNETTAAIVTIEYIGP